MTTSICDKCGRQLGWADAAMTQRMVERLVISPSKWSARLRAAVVMVCPTCDAYALGIETTDPVPFYSHDVAAFLTMHDWDWWNDDPAGCDIREWPDFGCLTFSEAALRSSVRHFQNAVSDQVGIPASATPKADLMAIVGIPLDSAAHDEWGSQLRTLHCRMGNQFSLEDLERAIRGLIAVLSPPDRSRFPKSSIG